MDLAGVGVWSSQLRYGDAGQAAEAAAELEELGFTALWIPDVGGPVLDSVDHLLSSTKRVVIATGILNLWMHEPADVAAAYASLSAKHGERFLLGIGVSHAPLIDSKEPGLYRKPLAATRAYLDAIDATDNPVPVGNRVLAALGPKMLELAATRSRGAHPYLVTPDHTRYAREHLGDGPLLLPEQTVLLTEDEAEARKLGTDWLRAYLALPS
jgi:probable F420-dependent oxidoreductase